MPQKRTRVTPPKQGRADSAQRAAPPALPYIRVPYSHLFRGLCLTVTRPKPHALKRPAKQPAKFLLLFSDGAQTFAELLHDRRGAALHVAAYTTARGTNLPERVWTVSRLGDQAGELEICLGRRFPDSRTR